ncbi:MAG: hypothetical protein RH946_19490 [Rhodospirillales bacterium]
MRYVVDETSWNLDDLEEPDLLKTIDEILDLVDDALAQGHGCCCSEELFGHPVKGGLSFYELFDGKGGISIPRDLIERHATIFNSMPKWEELGPPEVEAYDASIDGGDEEFACSICWAHARNLHSGQCDVAVIAHSHYRSSGPKSVRVRELDVPVWFVTGVKDTELYFRYLISNTSRNRHQMGELATFAFRNLDFAADCFDGISNMEGAYSALVQPIVAHLSAFSDVGSEIFRGPNELVAPTFGSLGVEISNENGATRANNAATKARTVAVNGVDRVFWWHSKLEPHRNRIYISPDDARVGGNIVVGIFARHLPT